MMDRIAGIFIRHWYLLIESKFRLVDLFYWPITQVVMWYWIGIYVNSLHSGQSVVEYFLVATLLLCILTRTQQSLSISVLEEIYSRNLIHIVTSPISMTEWVVAITLVSFGRVVVAMTPSVVICILMAPGIASANIFEILPLVFNLYMMGWWFGLVVTSFIIRFGVAAQNLSYMLFFIIGPVSAVYYPLDVLPRYVAYISYVLPSSYIFEQLKSTYSRGSVDHGAWYSAPILNIIYCALAALIFSYVLASARRNGRFFRVGE
jgi:ABC-2 type transport system permease protein